MGCGGIAICPLPYNWRGQTNLKLCVVTLDKLLPLIVCEEDNWKPPHSSQVGVKAIGQSNEDHVDIVKVSPASCERSRYKDPLLWFYI